MYTSHVKLVQAKKKNKSSIKLYMHTSPVIDDPLFLCLKNDDHFAAPIIILSKGKEEKKGRKGRKAKTARIQIEFLVSGSMWYTRIKSF